MSIIKSPLVSVIIPCYNSAKYLPEAIASVISQTYDNIEIIVVNDGSIDNTDDVIKPYLEKIIYVKQINAGPSAARNNGISHASGEYIAFLDADDIWFDTKIFNQMNYYNNHLNCGLVYCDRIIFNDFDNKIVGKTYEEEGEPCQGEILWQLIEKPRFATSTVIIKMEKLKSVGKFDVDLFTSEDTNLWIRIAYYYDIGFVNEVLVKRRIHDSNISCIDIDRRGTIDNYNKILSSFPDLKKNKEVYWKNLYSKSYFDIANDYIALKKYKLATVNIIQSSRIKINPIYIFKFIKYLINTIIRNMLSVLKKIIKIVVYDI